MIGGWNWRRFAGRTLGGSGGVFGLCLLVCAAAARGQCPPGSAFVELTNPDPMAEDEFGFAVAVSGNLALVSATPGNAGTVSVFNAASGLLLGTLDNPDPMTDGGFGDAVAISGTTAVVAKSGEEIGGVLAAGVVHVYDAATRAHLVTMENPAPSNNAHFGESVAISGSLVVVGASQDDPGGLNEAGTAYVFNAANGSLVSTLSHPLPQASNNFGYSVAIDGAVAVVGTFGDVSESAHIFDALTGALIVSLDDPTPADNDNFGQAVAISGGRVVVGAPWDSTVGVSRGGRAYIHDATSGALIAILSPLVPTANEHFGTYVAASGDTILVGAPRSDVGTLDTGAAYLFHAATGMFRTTLANPDPDTGDEFGWKVALSGDTAVVGAHWDDPGGVFNAGTVYSFTCLSFYPTATPTATPSPTTTPTPTATQTPFPCCPGDANRTGGLVDAGDFIAVQVRFGAAGVAGSMGDANCSGGFVDALDFIAVQANFGADCS